MNINMDIKLQKHVLFFLEREVEKDPLQEIALRS